MKKRNRFNIAMIVFLGTMFFVLIVFIFRINDIKILNKSKNLLSYLYTLDVGNYKIKNGMVFKDNSLLNETVFINGNGIVNVDKYKNVKFYVNFDDKCIFKTTEGSIKMIKNKCNNFNKVDVELAKNNSKISFILNNSDLEYKISTKDDYYGEWIKEKYNDNLVLTRYNQGDNYIWFKDKDGNISDVVKFKVDCLLSKGALYNPSVFYCSGSTVDIDNTAWVVLEDKNDSIKLMRYLPLSEKLSHCFNEKSNYCYYTKDEKMPEKWSNSYINYYLNNIFINELSNDLKDRLITNYICDEYDNVSCDNEICGGFSKEEINNYNWKCVNYTPSKVKIISYDEYNLIYSRISDKSVIEGNYWAINSYINDRGSSIQYNYEFYILENYTEKLDVRPVINVKK